MKTNLIQSYIENNTYAPSQVQPVKKPEADFDLNNILAYKTFIKPLPSNGKLVKNSIFDAPGEFFRDTKYTMNALKHSIKGDANDHELGKLNDLGMFAGGLAIASYLFTKKATPLTKVMEFVGLGSFFASMALWPKFALQLPARIIHGFNIRQQYIDNYGRKKPVFQDHQFIPWDLYSDEQIEKIGNRLHVPKDIPNRRDAIQEKMRKIALQNNTMWMLTSGFATPVMSALICNSLEKPILKWQENLHNKRAESILTEFSAKLGKMDTTSNTEALDNILKANKDKPLTVELVNSIKENLTKGLDFVTSSGLEKDLDNFLTFHGGYNVNDKTVDSVITLLKSSFEPLGLSKDELVKLLPSKEALTEAFAKGGLFGEGISDFSSHSKVVQKELLKSIKLYTKSCEGNTPQIKRINFLANQLIHSKEHGVNSLLTQAFTSQVSRVLSEDKISSLLEISKALNIFKAKTALLDRYAYIKVAQAPETILANSWNEITDGLLKTFHITYDEIKNTRYDRELMGKLLRGKFDDIVADDNLYEQVVKDLESKLAMLQSKTQILEGVQNGSSNSYRELVNTTFDEAGEVLRQKGFMHAHDNIVGKAGENGRASLKDLQLSYVADRIQGVKSSFYRLLNTLDVYRRISKQDQSVLDVMFKEFHGASGEFYPLKMTRQAQEEMIELCKQILIDGHSSDYAVKFFQLRSPELNGEGLDFSPFEVRNGKVVNKYLGRSQSGELVELANDKTFFSKVMRILYGGNLHSDTEKAVKNSNFYHDFIKYRENILNLLGCDEYFAKPHHLVDGKVIKSSSERKFLLTGCAPDEMFSKLGRQKFNSTKWFRMFGITGAVVLGVTVLSQFFMGKMKYNSNKENK